MRINWRTLVILVFLIGFLVIGLVGAPTSMTFIWPAYMIFGLAAILSIACLFNTTYFGIPKWAFGSVFLLLAYVTIRATDSEVAYFSREDSSLLIVCFIAYSLFVTLFTEVKWRRALFWVITALAVVNVVYALLQLFVSPTVWIIPGYERTFTQRIGGLFNQPDHFACFMAVTIPLLLASSLFGNHGRGMRVSLVVLAVMSMAVTLFSKSAVGYLAVAVSVGAFVSLSLFLTWQNLNRRLRKYIVTLGIVSSIVFGGILFTNFGSVYERITTKAGGIQLEQVWESARLQFASEPIAGTGSRSFYFHSRRHSSGLNPNKGTEPEFAHNEYLQVLAEYGLIGLLLVLAIAVTHFRPGFQFVSAYRGFKSATDWPIPRSDHLAWVVGGIAGLAAIAVQSCFDYVMHVPSIAILASALLGFLACPDPMSNALKEKEQTYLPGGSYLFVTRAFSFGSGLALVLLGMLFSRSEWHYEKARLAFEANPTNFTAFSDLEESRRLDPNNPYAYSLSAHVQVATIQSEMPEPARVAALEAAEDMFAKAFTLYPYDVFAAVGHSAVLDALGREDSALERIHFAREWAPSYGNLMLAEAEHHLRYGNITRAEESYLAARGADAFRNEKAADDGLNLITEWRRVAAIGRGAPNSIEAERAIPDVSIEERALSGQAEAVDQKVSEITEEAAPLLDELKNIYDELSEPAEDSVTEGAGGAL